MPACRRCVHRPMPDNPSAGGSKRVRHGFRTLSAMPPECCPPSLQNPVRHEPERAQVELFFKWINSTYASRRSSARRSNAVKTQIWIAMRVYVLVAIVKTRMNLPRALYENLQILSLSLFKQMCRISSDCPLIS